MAFTSAFSFGDTKILSRVELFCLLMLLWLFPFVVCTVVIEDGDDDERCPTRVLSAVTMRLVIGDDDDAKEEAASSMVRDDPLLVKGVAWS